MFQEPEESRAPGRCHALHSGSSPAFEWELFTAKVVPLVRRDTDEDALELLGCFSQKFRNLASVRYLEGRLLDKLGKSRRAARALDIESSVLPPSVAYEVQVRHAALLARTGRCERALPTLRKLGERRGIGRQRARVVAAECLSLLGKNAAAIRALRRLAKDNPRHWRIRFQLADVQAKAGRKNAAKRELRKLLVAIPDHPLSRRIKARLRKLGGDPELTRPEKLVQADQLLAARRWSGVLELLEELGEPADRREEAEFLHLEGMVLYGKRGRYLDAAKILKKAAELDGRHAADDAFHAARALSRADENAKAIAAYRELLKSHSRHRRAAEAEYRAALLDLNKGRARGARRMKVFLSGSRARRAPEIRREAQWALAFHSFERRRYREAGKLFGEYADEGEGAMVRGRGLYWQGRAMEAARQKRKAIESYEQAIDVEALHWYGLLAEARLAKLGRKRTRSFPEEAREGGEESSAFPADMAFYASIGLNEDALEVARLPRGGRGGRSGRESSDSLKGMLMAFQRFGAPQESLTLAVTRLGALRQPPSRENLWLWEAAYPRPYNEIVMQVAHEQGIEVAHVYATMRQESAFVPEARSRAGAVGLLQVLPATARSHARKQGVRFKRKMLLDPDWNIRFGVAEMAALHSSLGEKLPLTIASFNAGIGRVKGWLGETGEIETDRFVERIPFKETQNYVRRVYSHYARYQFLANPTEYEGVEIPETVGPVKSDSQ